MIPTLQTLFNHAKSSFSFRLLTAIAFYMLIVFTGNAQVKITDSSNLTLDPNSLLELESTNKGILIPRVSINDLSLPAPLTAPVPEGMLVYSLGGAITDGFYYWSGSEWLNMADGGQNIDVLTYSASDTIPKRNATVFASNTISLNLPEISVADTGLKITIKNTGGNSHLVTVRATASNTIEEFDSIRIRPKQSRTFISRGAEWIVLDRSTRTQDILDVGPDEPFKTICDALEFLYSHMTEPSVIRISGEAIPVCRTIKIDLPYALTIQGISYGSGTLEAGPGLEGKPMFRCISDVYFKMLTFDATTLENYGTLPGEDAIRFVGSDTYNEIKDCSFDSFNNAVYDSTNAEVWLFECDITNSQNNGILIQSDLPGTIFKVSETDFMNNKTSVNLSKGSSAIIQLLSGFYTNRPTDNAIVFNPTDFSFESLFISNNSWNHEGEGISGFDFSRTDGRDADAFIENNAGMENNRPHGKVNVTNNTLSTTCITANNWYKANWVITSDHRTNLNIEGNKVTFLSTHPREMTIFISGNVSVGNNNRVITVGIVKNGNSAVRYGETALRVTVANQPFQFSTIIHLEQVHKDDYFELYCSSANNNDVLLFQDFNMYIKTE